MWWFSLPRGVPSGTRCGKRARTQGRSTAARCSTPPTRFKAGFALDVGSNGESGAERVQALVPNAHVVKVFNTTGAENIRDPSYAGAATVMLYAGNDIGAKRVAL